MTNFEEIVEAFKIFKKYFKGGNLDISYSRKDRIVGPWNGDLKVSDKDKEQLNKLGWVLDKRWANSWCKKIRPR